MKLLETILIALAVVCFIVGVNQTFSDGFTNSYSFFMLMLSFFMAYGYVKIKRIEKENSKKTPQNIGKKK